MTHTPGPWSIVADVPGHAIGYRAIVANDNGEPGETICNPSPMGAANAALIAAAPDLLAMLTKLVGAIDRMPSNPADGLADAARELIAKATLEA